MPARVSAGDVPSAEYGIELSEGARKWQLIWWQRTDVKKAKQDCREIYEE